MTSLSIGIDFDNTIVCFDDLFYKAALNKGLIPPTVSNVKDHVRDYLRKLGKEDAWTELQGTVYGHLIKEASVFPGVSDFILQCKRNDVPVSIISHKTARPFLGHPYDLHAAALSWLEQNEFFSTLGLPKSRVFLELTKNAKMERIAKEGCTYFIDDLPEFLLDPAFPIGVQRILFDPQNKHPTPDTLSHRHSWKEISQTLLNA